MDSNAPRSGTPVMPDNDPRPDGCSSGACGPACPHTGCHCRWWSAPRGDGTVYCCDSMGWVTPAQAFDHSWDAYSDL
jgi:hypothetical protein